jgi:penicillin-binding protein 1A
VLELTNAFAVFASGGLSAEPRIVARALGPDGRPLRQPAADEPERVMTDAEAFVVTSLLQSVVQEGTASAARSLRRPIAGKTGTSNDARDAWFVGYTPEIVCGVWVGYDDHRPLGRREAGARTALPIWMEIVRAATRARPPARFPTPASGVVSARIDPASGRLAYEGQTNAIDEWFLDGTAPVERALPPDVTTPEDFLLQEGGAAPAAPATAVPVSAAPATAAP